MRHEPATAQLLGIIGTGDPADALAAGEALATFKDDPAVCEQITEAPASNAMQPHAAGSPSWCDGVRPAAT